jgi:hypothetical protein
MIKIEPSEGNAFTVTADQFATITGLILRDGLGLDYEIAERNVLDGMVWLWVRRKEGYPTRHWIRKDGEIILSEEADWMPKAGDRHTYIPSGGGFCARCDDMPGEGNHA